MFPSWKPLSTSIFSSDNVIFQARFFRRGGVRLNLRLISIGGHGGHGLGIVLDSTGQRRHGKGGEVGKSSRAQNHSLQGTSFKACVQLCE